MSINSASDDQIGSYPFVPPGSPPCYPESAMSVNPSPHQSSTGCVPAPGSCQSDLGYVGVVIQKVNRSEAGLTGCVPVPGQCLSAPGYVGSAVQT